MNIGVDIDGVLNNLDMFQVAEGMKYCYEHDLPNDLDINKYKVRDKFSWNKTTEQLFFKEKYASLLIDNTYLRPYTNEVMELLFKKHRIIIITARQEKDVPVHLNESMKTLTNNWLKNNGLLYDKLIFTETNKTDIILSEKIDIMIEDNPDYLSIISNIPIIFLCFDSSYNRKRFSNNVYRVYSWHQILSFIEKKE